MAKSRLSRAAARFKQLSCFGLEKEIVIPELLKELHILVPSLSNDFFFTNHVGAVSNMFFETTDMVSLFPLYQQEFLEKREKEYKGFAFSDAAYTQFGVHDFNGAVETDGRSFQGGDLYNLVMRPVGYDNNFLRIYIRDGGRVAGCLTMWRALGGGVWSSEVRQRLAALEPFFLHAVTVQTVDERSTADSGEIGLLIANAAGKMLFSSAEGRRLLFFASNPRLAADRPIIGSDALPARVAELCRNLSRIFLDDTSAPAPIHQHANKWGRFTFQAQWLSQETPGSGLVGITIRRKVPLPVMLMRNVEKLPLSPRQAEVCVLMATGASTETVAERLGISRHTANEHGRWIYNKLDVHGRTELVNKLLLAG